MRLSVTQVNFNDQMHLQCEVDTKIYSDTEIANMIKDISITLKKVTKLTGTIEFVVLASLADDGKVIDDLRTLG